MTEGVFSGQQARPAMVTDPEHAITARARARRTVAGQSRDADELRGFLTILALWPAQDQEEINAQTALLDRPAQMGRARRRPHYPKPRAL